MLILLFIFALIQHLQGAPTSIASCISGCDPSDIIIRDDSTTNRHLGTRQVNDIVVSCIATIFACTWTAMHPNIPGPCDSGWEVFKRQVTTMIYALLAPEAITAWALRQHLAARRIVKDYNEKIAMIEAPKHTLVERLRHSVTGWFHRKPLPVPLKKGEVVPWTITHGFFVQMGGFMFRQDGVPVQTLQYWYWNEEWSGNDTNMHYLMKKGCLDTPTTTEVEIRDRSKGDALSKTIVVLQTTWFIAKCIARWSSSLPVTELEVVTLGFAMLNALTYALWWNKPQSIGLPVYLERKKTTQSAAVQTGTEEDPSYEAKKGIDAAPKVSDKSMSASKPEVVATTQALIPPAKESTLATNLEKDWETRPGWQLIWRIMYRLIQAMLRPLSKMMDLSWTWVQEGYVRVPMFYSWGGHDVDVFVPSSVVASIFGLIHLIPAWFLDFPSHPEMYLWRISAAIITLQPALLALWIWAKGKNVWGTSAIRDDRTSPLAILAFIGLPLYIISRITLLTLAIVSLRALPEAAFVDIIWISYVPHL